MQVTLGLDNRGGAGQDWNSKGNCEGEVRGLKWPWGSSMGARGLQNTFSSRDLMDKDWRNNDQKSGKSIRQENFGEGCVMQILEAQE